MRTPLRSYVAAGALVGAAAALAVFGLRTLAADLGAGPPLRRLVSPAGWALLAAAGGLATRRAREAAASYFLTLAAGLAAAAAELLLIGIRSDFDELFWPFLVNYFAFAAVLGLAAWLPERRHAGPIVVLGSAMAAAVLGLFALPILLYVALWYVRLNHTASVAIVATAYGALIWGYLGYARTAEPSD